MPRKARVFVVSSRENLPVARAVRASLSDDAEVTVWDEDGFALSTYALESLTKLLDDNDFAVCVCAPTDQARIRQQQLDVARDNVIFELGLFMGHMGTDRAFWLSARGAKAPHISSDLGGIVHLEFEEGDTADPESIEASLAAAGDKIRRHVATLGSRTDRTGHIVPMRQALCLASSQYTLARFKEDIKYIHAFFSEREVTHEQGVTAEHFQSYFEPNCFWDIVHLGLFIDKENQRMLFDAPPGGGHVESLSLQAIEAMIKDCGASLVVIITCDSLRFGEQLARFTNVIAGHQAIAPRASRAEKPWDRTRCPPRSGSSSGLSTSTSRPWSACRMRWPRSRSSRRCASAASGCSASTRSRPRCGSSTW